MKNVNYALRILITILGLVSIVSCNGINIGRICLFGTCEPTLPTPTYTIGGTVTGLAGSGLTLQNNGGDNINITSGSFVFPTKIESGYSYDVTILTQPTNPFQTCVVNNGSGVADRDITTISIVCTTVANTYTISGSVSGSTGSGLVLRNFLPENNHTEDLSITANGVFSFTIAIPDTYNYIVSVLNHPTGQSCTTKNISGTVSGADVTDLVIMCSKVSPLHPTHGANWNDYVQGNNIADATDSACTATIGEACLHGGAIRVVELSGISSCTGITASDTLGVFSWICDETTNPVRVISHGFTTGKGLPDLVDFSTPTWKENSVTIYQNGLEIETTPPSVWWSNPVKSNTTGGNLDIEGTIYTVPVDTASTAYELTADKVALIAAPGITIDGPGAYYKVIYAHSSNFVWIEGMTINATGDSTGVYWHAVKFSVLRNISTEHANSSGIHIVDSYNSTLFDITSNYNNYYGVYFYQWSKYNNISNITTNNNKDGLVLAFASHNTLSNISASNNLSNGIRIYSYYNVLSDVITSNQGKGVYLESGSNNMFSNIIASNNGQGIYLSSNTSHNTFSNITTTNNSSGTYLSSSSNNLFSNVATANNAWGIYLSTSSNNNTFSNIAASNNNTGIHLSSSSNNYFTGVLKVGNNSDLDCYESGGSNPGITNDTCANNDASDATLSSDISLANTFSAKVTTDDTANTSDTNGIALQTDITDWQNFETAYRMWGKYGSAAFPDSGHRGQCNPIDTCQIWDWSLLSSDAVIKNVLSLPSGYDTLTHTRFDGITQTFLRSAVEIQNDHIGNDNTLCESNESCIHASSIGAYQGHGNIISAGTFSNGTITNVNLLKYETQGY